MQERLLQVGDWLKVNGEAIYETKKWRFDKENDLVFIFKIGGKVL